MEMVAMFMAGVVCGMFLAFVGYMMHELFKLDDKVDPYNGLENYSAPEVCRSCGADLSVKRIAACCRNPAPDASQTEAMSRVKVPTGQTPLNDDLCHPLLDAFNEGIAARDNGTGSPYHGHSLEHCLHTAGWVQRDLRLALDAANTHPAALKAENERLMKEAAAIR